MDGDANALEKGWVGSIPRSILLSKTGKQLIQWPIKQIETLRAENVSIQEKQLKGGSVLEVLGVTASQKAEFMVPDGVDPRALGSQQTASFRGMVGPFGLLVLASQGLTEQTAVFFRIFRSREKYVVPMCSDQSRSTFREGPDKTTYGAFIDIDPRQEKITLRTPAHHSVVESFSGKGRACITARVYPALAVDRQAHLYVFNNGTVDVTISRLDAWSMKKAQLVSANI
ncbi:Glycosyl hydrolase family 32 [Theobroma cacao]|nr:Glycosyl hydrolase family 32 [Theobroma cacao]